MKTAFVFSGQGAQYSGMGKELYDNFSECLEIFEQADNMLDFPLTKYCFDANEKENLDKTEYCQPAIFTVCAAVLALLEKSGVSADFTAGLSLGEYTALTYSGAFSFTDALLLLRRRGLFMAEASKLVDGVMSAVMGILPELAEKACAEASAGLPDGEYACVSNYNAPGQSVISGARKAVEKAEALCAGYGAKRAVRLSVGGPYHTGYMEPASVKLHDELIKIKPRDMRVPVISNVDAEIIGHREEIYPTLLKQIESPVRWEACVLKLTELGTETFVEIGPGRTLSSFIRKINPEARVLNIENLHSYENTVRELLK